MTAIINFPMVRRVGRIRDVASRMMTKTTQRHAEHYQRQVTEAFAIQFERIGLAEAEQRRELTAFWRAVEVEMIRLAHSGYGTGGAA